MKQKWITVWQWAWNYYLDLRWGDCHFDSEYDKYLNDLRHWKNKNKLADSHLSV